MELYFYTTDESFSYGDWSWGGVCHQTGYHGFSVDVDIHNNIDMSTFEPEGDYLVEMENIKTLEELKEYLASHLHEVRQWDEYSDIKNIDTFKEFIQLIDENIQERKAA